MMLQKLKFSYENWANRHKRIYNRHREGTLQGSGIVEWISIGENKLLINRVL
jgi:hypothetical protein